MKDTIKLGLTLFLITAVAAGVLAFTNGKTAPIIAEREREEAFGAFLEMFPDADNFVEIDAEKLVEIQSTNATVNGVLEAKSDDEIIGYVFQVAAGGYAGQVNTIVGISLDNTIAGISIGSHGETPDIGDRIEDSSFTDSYIGKTTTEQLVAVGSPSAENEVMLISGATISSYAVLAGVNDANNAYLTYFTDVEIVEETAEEKQARLFSELFADADGFTPVEQGVLGEIMDSNQFVKEVFEAKAGGQVVGYIFNTVTAGYGGDLPVMTGIDIEGKLTGIRVGDNAETPGLGTQIEEPTFTDTFIGKTASEKLVAVGSPSAENEVMMISGATISVSGVLTGVNDANDAYLRYFSDVEVIEETEEEKRARVFGELFVDAAEFAPVDQSVLDGIMESNRFVKEIFEAKAGDQVLGYIFNTISGGYGGEIPVMTGIDIDGKLTGIRVGANSETPGLGTQIEEPGFTDTFIGKTANEKLVAVGAPSAQNEIMMVTGATVSTDGVLYGVNGAIEAFNTLISQ